MLAGVAVILTCVPCEKLAVQVDGQLIPAGLLVIVPAPAGGAMAVNWGVGGGGGVDFITDPQPASVRVDKATNEINHNDEAAFMAQFSRNLSKTIAILDEDA